MAPGAPVFDHYGFRRPGSPYSLEEQLQWEADYERVLDRRRARWDREMSDSGNMLPERSSTMLRFVRKGIPRHLRALAWFKYSGAEMLMRKHRGAYEHFAAIAASPAVDAGTDSEEIRDLQTSFEAIDKDLHRTFPDNLHFRTGDASTPGNGTHTGNAWISSLRRILRAFAVYSTPVAVWETDMRAPYRIGYAQSLNFVAGLMLIVFARCVGSFPETESGTVLLVGYFEAGDLADLPPAAVRAVEQRVFFLLCAVVGSILPRGLYQNPDLAGALLEQDVFWDILIARDARQFGLRAFREWWCRMDDAAPARRKSPPKDDPGTDKLPGPLKVVTFGWMLTNFVGATPVETTLRIWDCLFYEGFTVVHRVLLSLLLLFQRDITRRRDGPEAWRTIKRLPETLLDCHGFMEFAFRPSSTVGIPSAVRRRSRNGLWRLAYPASGVGDVTTELLTRGREAVLLPH